MIGISRSLLQVWKARQARGAEARALRARRLFPRIGEEKVARARQEFTEYHEAATEYFVAVRCGVSTTTAGAIRRAYAPEQPEELEERPSLVCEWLKRHACWSIDTMYVRSVDGWRYLMVVLEEYARWILGWGLYRQRLAIHARGLLTHTIEEAGVAPLLVKHDRGSEFTAGVFQEALEERGIVSLPSPGHYAPFNGKTESNNRLLRKFTRELEERRDATEEQLRAQIERGVHIINRVVPRRIFDGKTSWDVAQEGPVATEEERWLLRAGVARHREVLAGLALARGTILDSHRKTVVRLLQDVNLCRVVPRGGV